MTQTAVSGADGAAGRIRAAWDIASKIPGGKTAMSIAFGKAAPYTGSIGARVESLSEGRSVVKLRDRKAVRNHLRCIHAIALVNLAEIAGNLAVAYSMPSDARFIVAGINIDYLAKARGTITAEGACPKIEGSQRKEYEATVRLYDESRTEVAQATLRTLVGPIQ